MELRGFDNAHNQDKVGGSYNVINMIVIYELFERIFDLFVWKIYCKLLSGFFYHNKVWNIL